jgi:hypothetical protein
MEAQDVQAERPRTTRTRKWIYLAAILIETAVLGGIGVFVEDGSDIEKLVFFPDVILFTLFVRLWCGADAAERGFRLTRGLSLWIILCSLIAVPVYFFRSRGRRGFRALGLAVLFLFVATGVDYLSAQLVYFVHSRLAGQ